MDMIRQGWSMSLFQALQQWSRRPPGVGAFTALIFKTAIDDPTRIAKSRDVGPLFGLTPGRYQSGETDIIGRITKVEDVMVRTAL